MNPKSVSLTSGLYLVATPIGTARDITLRALDVLASADVLVAEDTRTLRKLMEIHGIDLRGRHIQTYHDHSPENVRRKLVSRVLEGASMAYASEAGMPMIADPGFSLSRAVTEAGGYVTTVPGASAPLVALSLSGLPTDSFFFGGFLPNTKAARRKRLEDCRDIPGTLVFFDSPKRVGATLDDMSDVLGAYRSAALARELTKKFETIQRGVLSQLAENVRNTPVKGEIVLLVGQGHQPNISDEQIDNALEQALRDASLRDAVDMVTDAFSLKRKEVYKRALELNKGNG